MTTRQMIEAESPTFFSVVLDEGSQSQLRKLAVHPVVHCHHMTVAYHPDESYLPQLRALIGREYLLNVTALATDERGQAVRVNGAPSLNQNPHVTISCADGTPPQYSNELLQNEEGEPIDLVLRGILTEEVQNSSSPHDLAQTPDTKRAPSETEDGSH